MKGMLNKKTLTLVFLLLFLTLLVGCFPPKNQSPIITSTPITLAEVNELYTYEVEATDPDGDSLTYSLEVKPSGMTIIFSTGLIKWTPAAKGDYPVFVKVSDGTLDITQSFTIVVSEAEEPGWTPIITSTPITTATIGVLYAYDVNATDPDGDTLTYFLTTKPSGMAINSATGLIMWTPATKGNYAVVVKVFDGVLDISQSFTITVSGLPAVNQAPTIYSIPITTATVGVTYFYDVNATDPDGDTSTYSLTAGPSGMNVSSASGLIMWTPTAKGNYAVTVKVSDGALSDTQGFTIVVSKPTIPPETYTITASAGNGGTISPLGDVTVKEGFSVLFAITPNANYGIEKVLVDGVSVGAVSTYTFTNVAKDHTIYATFSTVEAVNQAPTITSEPITTAILGVEYIYGVEATDPDNDVLTYSLTVKPVGMSIGSTTGIISWIPNATGDYDVTVEVSDGELSGTQPFTITVVTVEITRIEVDPDAMTLYEEVSETIKSVTAIYEIKKGFEASIALEDCTYLSSNIDVATVVTGVIKAVAEGTATIYVTYAGETDTVIVEVLLPLDKPVHNITKDIHYITIQEAIVEADPGNTIEVAPGTYVKQIIINKALTVKSTDGAIGTILNGEASLYHVYIQSSSVTFEGFTVTNPSYAGGGDVAGILVQSTGELVSNVQILNNIITQIRSESGSSSSYGATGITIGTGVLSDIVISGNTITDIHNPDGGIEDHTCGINVWDGASNVAVSNNTISDIKYNGIILEGASNVTISGNDITECESGVRVDPRCGEISNVTISGNDITECESGVRVILRTNTLSGLTINNNNLFSNTEYGVLNSMEQEVDATYNWWGSEFGPKHVSTNPGGLGNAVSDNVDYEHWLPSPH